MILPAPSTLWLLVALLLALWLLTRVRERERGPPARRMPITPDEFGRVVFEIARNRDLGGWRGLFLAGGEARAVLGDGAADYLDRRTPAALADALAALGACLPQGSTYSALHLADDGGATLEVRMVDGAVRPIPIGTAVRVGGVWRMQLPVEKGGL